MKNLFTTYPIAAKLKELGFDEPCLMYYNIRNKEKLHSNVSTSTLYGAMISEEEYIKERQIKAPLWQQAITWLLKYFNDKYPMIQLSQFNDESWILKPNLDIDTHFCTDNVEDLINKLLDL